MLRTSKAAVIVVNFCAPLVGACRKVMKDGQALVSGLSGCVIELALYLAYCPLSIVSGAKL